MKFEIEWHDTLVSTNSFLRERADMLRGRAGIPVAAAVEQTGGRGRGERSWSAARGQNLTFSILLRPGADAMNLVSLPMATAMAVADLLAGEGIEPRLKWPNDVLAGSRKICGILADVLADKTVVLGVGLNVNMPLDDAARIDQPATSMKIMAARDFDLKELLDKFLGHFAMRYDAWLDGGFASLRNAWERFAQKPGDESSRGVIAGYGEHGELLVRGADGATMAVWTA